MIGPDLPIPEIKNVGTLYEEASVMGPLGLAKAVERKGWDVHDIFDQLPKFTWD